MKTATPHAVITPTILVLALLAAAVIFLGVTGKQVPLLSDVRLDIVLFVVLGMAICALGGIGRVSATSAWSHPLSIIGYLIGGAILLITVAVFTGLKLPFIQGDRQALLVIAVLAGVKVLDAVIHSALARS